MNDKHFQCRNLEYCFNRNFEVKERSILFEGIGNVFVVASSHLRNLCDLRPKLQWISSDTCTVVETSCIQQLERASAF